MGGNQQRRRTRWLAVISAVAATVSACGQADNDASTSADNTTDAATPADALIPASTVGDVVNGAADTPPAEPEGDSFENAESIDGSEDSSSLELRSTIIELDIGAEDWADVWLDTAGEPFVVAGDRMFRFADRALVDLGYQLGDSEAIGMYNGQFLVGETADGYTPYSYSTVDLDTGTLTPADALPGCYADAAAAAEILIFEINLGCEGGGSDVYLVEGGLLRQIDAAPGGLMIGSHFITTPAGRIFNSVAVDTSVRPSDIYEWDGSSWQFKWAVRPYGEVTNGLASVRTIFETEIGLVAIGNTRDDDQTYDYGAAWVLNDDETVTRLAWPDEADTTDRRRYYSAVPVDGGFLACGQTGQSNVPVCAHVVWN